MESLRDDSMAWLASFDSCPAVSEAMTCTYKVTTALVVLGSDNAGYPRVTVDNEVDDRNCFE